MFKQNNLNVELSRLPVVVFQPDKRHPNSFCVRVIWHTQSTLDRTEEEDLRCFELHNV